MVKLSVLLALALLASAQGPPRKGFIVFAGSGCYCAPTPAALAEVKELRASIDKAGADERVSDSYFGKLSDKLVATMLRTHSIVLQKNEMLEVIETSPKELRVHVPRLDGRACWVMASDVAAPRGRR
jgi:hypothetical protein